MRVYAAGRNEFGQLSFGPDEHGGPEDFPQDIHSFTPILQGDTIDQVVASSSYTVSKPLERKEIIISKKERRKKKARLVTLQHVDCAYRWGLGIRRLSPAAQKVSRPQKSAG